ncbi:hypothetical protein D3C76_1717930 [compost metagenome]
MACPEINPVSTIFSIPSSAVRRPSIFTMEMDTLENSANMWISSSVPLSWDWAMEAKWRASSSTSPLIRLW